MPQCRVTSHYTYTLLIAIALILVSFPMLAATYYVSSSTGDDTNNGITTATPWKSLNEVSTTNFATSDSILFKRGDTLYGEFSKPLWLTGYNGTPSNHFYIGAYGTGNKPIIMMDCSNLVWTKRAGYDSIYAAPAIGFCYSSLGYEYVNGEWSQMTQYSDNISNLDNPDSLAQYLNNLTPSSYGPAHRDSPIDTVYCRTHDGLPPKVKILRQNFFKASYLTMENLDFRNGFHALNLYPCNNGIFRNLYMRNFIGIMFFLAGHSSENLVEYCRADSGAYTAFYSWYSHRNLYRYDTVYIIRDTIMGIYSNIEQAGFGAERDTAAVWEYCAVYGADDSGWDTFFNLNDTIRFCKVENSTRGYMLQGVGWVAHDNTYTSMGVSGDLAFKVDIRYAWGEDIYLTSSGQTHVYNNTITAMGSGLWASLCAEGSSILFENNTVHGMVSNTNFSRLETINTKSINNKFCGDGRWLTGTWPNQTSYNTLAALLAATGYEDGSVWHSDCSNSPTGTFTVTPDSLPEDGGIVILEWTSVNAVSASISPLIGTVATSGTQSATVDSTTVFALTLEGSGGTSIYTARVIVGTQSLVIELDTLPKFLRIESYPNPFNTGATIEFSLPHYSYVSLKVFDVLGREVETLAHGIYSQGIHRFRWNTDGMASGVYYCRFTAGSYTETLSMVLVR
jgi:hypothetical protein